LLHSLLDQLLLLLHSPVRLLLLLLRSAGIRTVRLFRLDGTCHVSIRQELGVGSHKRRNVLVLDRQNAVRADQRVARLRRAEAQRAARALHDLTSVVHHLGDLTWNKLGRRLTGC
jgi:hypothetical protein